MRNIQWNYDSVENWSQVVEGEAVCDFCGKKDIGIYFISEEESVCLSCILEFFRGIAIDKILDTTDGFEILKAFEPESSPTLKIGMLMNLDELLKVLEGIPETNRLHILYYITLSLGFNSSHPLSSLLRSIAVNKIILGDNVFLKVLLDDIEVDLTHVYPIDPQIFLYNLSLALSFLAPYNKLTRALIERVLEIAKNRKYTFVINWFVLKDGYYLPNGQFFSGEYDTAKLIDNYKIANKVSISTSASSDYRVKQALDEIYTLKYLKNIYNLYLHNIHEKAGTSPHFVWPGKRAKKNDYVRIFAEILMDKNLVKIFLDELPPWVRTSFEEMLWEDKSLSLNEFMKRGNLEIPKVNKYDFYYEPKLPPESQLFQVWVKRKDYSSRGEVFLFLDKLQADLFRSCLPVPDYCRLQLKDSYNQENFVSNNTETLTELQILAVYLQQVGIKRAKNGIKILKSSIKDIRTVCNVEELYPGEKGLENLRLIMILELLEKFLKNRKEASQLSSEMLLKTIYSFYFNPKESKLFNFSQFLDYLKFRYLGRNKSDTDRFYQERVSVQKLLDQLPVGKWVELSNIYRYFNSLGIMPQPVHISGYAGDIYFNSNNNNSYGNYMERIDVSNGNMGEVLFYPYLKLLMFILNTLGVVEIAYTMPVNDTFHNKNNPWLSVYDGIKEVSLTSLGAWLLGRTKTCEGIKKEVSSKVTLDNKRLVITVEGRDPVIDLTLTRMSRSLGPGSFLVSPDIFLQDCESARDIKDKIKRFKTNIAEKPPRIWEDFFKSLLYNANPLEYKKEEMLLFKLDADNKDLISLLFSDPYLKWNIMKVEDYHILIKESSYKAVKSRLAEHGYFLPGVLNLN